MINFFEEAFKYQFSKIKHKYDVNKFLVVLDNHFDNLLFIHL